jgi:hypothetical protein
VLRLIHWWPWARPQPDPLVTEEQWRRVSDAITAASPPKEPNPLDIPDPLRWQPWMEVEPPMLACPDDMCPFMIVDSPAFDARMRYLQHWTEVHYPKESE